MLKPYIYIYILIMHNQLTFIHLRNEPSGFSFERDCPTRCVSTGESCTIHEISPDEFEKICYTAENYCLEAGGPAVVCLRHGHDPVGGSLAEWNDYKNKYFPTPSPKPAANRITFWMQIVMTFTGGVVTGILGQLSGQSCNRRRIQNQRGASRVLIDDDEESIYRSTVVPSDPAQGRD
jgi:hypothetical protein